jgi:hypothetical protein
MDLPSPFSALHYENRDDDLVRFTSSAVDESMSRTVRSLFDSLDEHRDEVRRGLSVSDAELLILFARRSGVLALRSQSLRSVSDALDAYALLPHEYDVPWESWFKATLFVGRELGLDLDDAQRRFRDGATIKSGQRADVAFEAMTRVDSLSQCHVIEVSTTYGTGLVETTVVREQGNASWGGITGQPVALGQYQVDYAPTTNLAQLAVDVADALDASDLVVCSSIRQDQLVGATFDLVTSGSYIDSLGCLSFFADGVAGRPTFSVCVAEVAAETHYDVHYDAEGLAQELAEAADDIEEQAALSRGPCVVVLSAMPNFDATDAEESVDLSEFLDVVARAVSST